MEIPINTAVVLMAMQYYS